MEVIEMDEVSDVAQNLQDQTQRVNDLQSQLDEAKQELDNIASSLRDTTENAVAEAQNQTT